MSRYHSFLTALAMVVLGFAGLTSCRVRTPFVDASGRPTLAPGLPGFGEAAVVGGEGQVNRSGRLAGSDTGATEGGQRRLNAGDVDIKDHATRQAYAPVDDIDLYTHYDHPRRAYLIVRGKMPTRCSWIQPAVVKMEGNRFVVQLPMVEMTGPRCPADATAYTREIDLPFFGKAPGPYRTFVNGKEGPPLVMLPNGAPSNHPRFVADETAEAIKNQENLPEGVVVPTGTATAIERKPSKVKQPIPMGAGRNVPMTTDYR